LGVGVGAELITSATVAHYRMTRFSWLGVQGRKVKFCVVDVMSQVLEHA
jgi:hypothetical protein